MELQEILEQLDLTPNQLALKVGMLPPIIYSILRNGNPTLKTILKFNKLGIICTIKNGKIIWSLENNKK